jgi:hypothetical protein
MRISTVRIVSHFGLMARPNQNAFQLSPDALGRESGCTGSRDDEEIAGRRQLGSVAAEKLAHLPFDAVAYHRVAHLSAYRDPQPGFGPVIRPADHDEICGLLLAAGTR